MNLEVYDNKIPKSKISDWEKLWAASPNGTLFNSPAWYFSCMHLHRSIKTFFIYKDNKLFAVISLTKQLIPRSIGKKYLDKTNLLMKGADMQSLSQILRFFSKGNTLFKEMPDSFKSRSDRYMFFSSKNPYIPLTHDPYEFLGNKRRNGLKNKIIKHGERLSLEEIREIKTNHLELIWEIESKSNKTGRNRSIFDNSNARRLFTNISKYYPHNKLFLLYFDQRPVAYLYGIYNNNSTEYMAYNMAYLEESKNLEPGKILIFNILQKLKDEGVRIFDFSRGMTSLKKQFTPYSRDQYDLYQLHSPVLKIAIIMKDKHSAILMTTKKIIKNIIS